MVDWKWWRLQGRSRSSTNSFLYFVVKTRKSSLLTWWTVLCVLDYLQDACRLGNGGRLGYIDAISEMIEFRKLHGASEAVFRKFSATELYLKRARKTTAKMMRLQWTQDLDIETSEAKAHRATMEELLEVVKFYLPRCENTVKICKSRSSRVNPSDLAFATKFVAMYLFIKVKGLRMYVCMYVCM